MFFRLLQGVGAGILLPIEQVILRETFPPKELGLAMGIYGITIMLGPTIGPLLGGYIIDNLTWRWIFFINIPIGILSIAMMEVFIHDPPHLIRHKNSMDILGVLLLVITIGSLHILLERGERLDWFETYSNVLLAFTSFSAFCIFVAHQLEGKKPLVNLRIFKNIVFSSSVLIGGMVSFVVFATLFLLPIFMQDALGYTATKAGLVLVPRALLMMVAFPLVGMIYRKISPKILIATGLVLGCYSSYLMSRFNVDTGMINIVFPQLIQGIAIALILTPISTVALMYIKKEQLGEAASLNNLMRQVGGSIGVAVFASLLSKFKSQFRWSLVHNFVQGESLFTNRLARVVNYFWSLGGIDRGFAIKRSLVRLNGRFDTQLSFLAFGHAFEWIAVLFIALVPLLFLMRDSEKN